ALLKIIGYGTERYPEKTARGLRVLNVTAWAGALFSLAFAVYDAAAELWTIVVINIVAAAFQATVPLWHRFGPLAAPLVYVVGVFANITLICSLLGTDSGMQFQYLAIAAGIVLVVGTERVALLAAVGAVA